MDTHFKRTKSFGINLFLSVGTVFLLFALCFSIYQYNRERQFKIDLLDATLRTYCYEMVQGLGEDSLMNERAVGQYVSSHHIEGLRVTIVDSLGNVLLDSYEPSSVTLDNHLHRKEIAEALRTGQGYDIKRTSATNNETYFYSATRFEDHVVRLAVPYSAELTQSLQADNAYLLFALLLTILLIFVLYLSTSRISRHIRYLREFAIRAEEGQHLDHELERSLPDDELGDICHTITSLYWKLRNSEEDKTRLKRQLTQNAAHELKTPVSSIHGYLESIIENPDMPEEKRRYFLERCYAQSQRMTNLLADMTTLMRLDESQPLFLTAPYVHNDTIDIVSLIHFIMDEVDADMTLRGITPTLRLPERMDITGDRSLLYSLFRNMVDNTLAYATGADDFTIEGGETEDGYSFRVSDNGQGVAPEHLPHIFERFYRVDKGRSRKVGGTGLGLSIVKNVVAMHGGNIVAENTPGGGLTIRFNLKKHIVTAS